MSGNAEGRSPSRQASVAPQTPVPYARTASIMEDSPYAPRKNGSASPGTYLGHDSRGYYKDEVEVDDKDKVMQAIRVDGDDGDDGDGGHNGRDTRHHRVSYQEDHPEEAVPRERTPEWRGGGDRERESRDNRHSGVYNYDREHQQYEDRTSHRNYYQGRAAFGGYERGPERERRAYPAPTSGEASLPSLPSMATPLWDSRRGIVETMERHAYSQSQATYGHSHGYDARRASSPVADRPRPPPLPRAATAGKLPQAHSQVHGQAHGQAEIPTSGRGYEYQPACDSEASYRRVYSEHDPPPYGGPGGYREQVGCGGHVYGASEEYARDKPYERYERKGGSWWEEREQRDQNSHGGREYERHRDWAQRTERAGQVGQAQKRHSSALVPSPPLTPRRRRGVKGKGVWRHENASMEAATQRDKYSFDALVVAVQYSSPVSDSEVCTPVAEGMSRPEASGSKPMRESTPEGIPAGTVRGTPVMSERKKLPPTAAAAMPPPALPMGPNTDNDLSVLLMAQRQGPWMHPLPAGLIEHVPKDSEESFEPVSGMVVKGRLFTDSILAMGPYAIRLCHNCRTDTPGNNTWRRSKCGPYVVCNKCGLHETSRGEARPGKAEDHHAVYTVRKLLDRPLGNPSKGLPLPRDLKRKAKYVPKKSAVGAGDAGDAGGTGAAPVKAKAKPKSRLGKNVVLAGSALDEAPVLAPAPVPVATPAPAKEVIAPLEEMLFPTGCHLGDLGLDRDDGAPVKRSKSF